LDQLLKDPNSGLARVLSGDEVKRLRGCPEAAFLVELKPGFMFGSETKGPLVTDSTLRGMHGYLADRTEMNSTFLIAGPGVSAGRTLGEIDMRDIAPTLAGILGIRPRCAGPRNPFRRRAVMRVAMTACATETPPHLVETPASVRIAWAFQRSDQFLPTGSFRRQLCGSRDLRRKSSHQTVLPLLFSRVLRYSAVVY